jgi:predicted nuclease with TOPRIM domain
LSQPRQITLTDLNEWIKKETAPTLEPLTNKATSILKEVQNRISDTLEINQQLYKNSEAEMQKNNPKTHRFARNANKFSHGLTQILNEVKIPPQVSYQTLQALNNSLEKTVTTTLQLRAEAYRFITPYFIFDRRKLDVVIKRLSDIHNELRNFITSKYSKAKTIEDTATAIDKLQQTINRTGEIQKEKQQLLPRGETLQQELTQIQQEITNIQGRQELIEITMAEDQIKELRDNVKHNLRYLQKPFYKLQSLARSGEIAIPVDEAKKLGEYLNDPFEALATEDEGYPTLKNMLGKLNEAITKNKLKLKSTRLRKAQEQIESVLNKASLNTLQQNCKQASTHKKQLLTSETTTNLQKKLTELQNQLKQQQKENEATTTRIKILDDEHKKLQEKIQNERKELEKTVFQLTGKHIQITVPPV